MQEMVGTQLAVLALAPRPAAARVGSAAAASFHGQASCVDRQHGMPQIHMLITASWFLLTSGLSGDSPGRSARPSPLRLGPPAAVLNGGAWRWFILDFGARAATAPHAVRLGAANASLGALCLHSARGRSPHSLFGFSRRRPLARFRCAQRVPRASSADEGQAAQEAKSADTRQHSAPEHTIAVHR